MPEPQRTVHTVLSVPDVSCAHCKMAIEKAVGRLPGVARVEVEVEAKTVAVEFDRAAVQLATIEQAIEEEGYTVAGEQAAGA
jgi:copper chaperone